MLEEPGETMFVQKKGEIVEEKKCTTCLAWKELCMFSKDMSAPDCLRRRCKICDKENKRRKSEQPLKRKVAHMFFPQQGEITIGEKDGEYFFIEEEPTMVEKKMCSLCKKWKILDKFYKDTRSWDRLEARCKKCKLVYFRKYREEKKVKFRRITTN
ncbi:Hypothetical protein ZAZAV_540 [Cedratvirus Zaza IHUMI]|uniref:Uncharacterized protein n=1 Tax=Cedratvirus Zaza IHUMI TaxID=2126979 RepID=A0A2R8FFQ2_9VIRU|nr:Hypothetical protein ZAZAV_540 [Cedratvirus Zaza IHUMI]